MKRKTYFGVSLILAGLIVLLVLYTSCTPIARTQMNDGTMWVNLPDGQELISASLVGQRLCYLTRPMDSTYVPVRKTFTMQIDRKSYVIFIEHQND